ncbi:LLM class F420-dependent oxidoreductase [Cryptosporangium arvum]|uniref:F420-dependent oxidoreductase, G6PDH family n=1 Tax=Cryptosporangium arvum DSM 44712 TaxID=927661 RepID=A0A010ZP66_9ACTN|nr:LLM class F420-dependent oxidoreductase [Cryptosporangium arvum]EXG79022.1 F420-dependent oxidoreductase, G6PDH family [Cryptosporangium arvum DSM 44712]
MVNFGYTLMCEQAGPTALVSHARRAEETGFDFEVISDHYNPWLDAQGHAPNAWSVLGAVSQVTERVPLMTYVTCPTLRYHPAVIAQNAATTGLLSDGRFWLGLGAGENLNEHVVGRGWPPANIRHEMLSEAVDIIAALFTGEYVNYVGEHFRVDSAKLWDVPDSPPPIGIAVSGKQSAGLAAENADFLIAVEPVGDLIDQFERESGKQGAPKVGQLPICFDADRSAAVTRAHEQFRWFGNGWKVNAELPGPAGFEGATQFVREEDVAESIPCGSDPAAVVEAARPYVEAGFTHLAFVQIGGEHQEGFLDWSEKELLPALRESFRA